MNLSQVRLIRYDCELSQPCSFSLVPKQGITAWEMSKLVFPKASDINRFLAVSEAMANLDLAVAERQLRMEVKDEVEIYFYNNDRVL